MEIILKGINFEDVAVKRIGAGYKADIFGYADTEGNLQSSTANTRTDVIQISNSMRTNGFVIIGSRHWTTNPAVVFYNSSEASATTFVGVYTDDQYGEHNMYVAPEYIPAGATYFIANGYKDHELTVWENFLDDITSDYGFTNGFITQQNEYVENSTWLCSKMLPIDNSITYYPNNNRYAVYDSNLNFIRLFEPMKIREQITLGSNVAYIRICGLISNGEPYLKY